jgi:haloalkane dehalogenase
MNRQHFKTEAGTMSYIDSGQGRPVVFVHGNPSSSAEFKFVIEALGPNWRSITADHIGFGASSKPHAWGYRPIEHAVNMAAFLDHLDLHDVTLVVSDWGGPIGLSWALEHPERVAQIIVTNTWFWPVNRSLYYQGFSRFMGGPIGQYLIRKHNFFCTQVVKRAWGTAAPLTPELHAEFTSVHPDPKERTGMMVLPGEIIGSTPWLTTLWQQRRVLDSIHISLVWGMRDIAFRADMLEQWIEEFPTAKVERLHNVGHFVCLEAPQAVINAIVQDHELIRV